MFSQTNHQSLTRRGSKLLVELVIGVIGILGIMLAQVCPTDIGEYGANLQKNTSNQVINVSVTQVTPKVDWLEILF